MIYQKNSIEKSICTHPTNQPQGFTSKNKVSVDYVFGDLVRHDIITVRYKKPEWYSSLFHNRIGMPLGWFTTYFYSKLVVPFGNYE